MPHASQSVYIRLLSDLRYDLRYDFALSPNLSQKHNTGGLYTKVSSSQIRCDLISLRYSYPNQEHLIKLNTNQNNQIKSFVLLSYQDKHHMVRRI